MLGVYDISQELEPFQGRSEEEITQILKNWGVRAIFGGYKSEKLVSSLHHPKIEQTSFDSLTLEQFQKDSGVAIEATNPVKRKVNFPQV